MPPSETSDTLLKQTGQGGMHIDIAVRIAQANRNDGMQSERVEALASLGDGSGSNQERNLHKWLTDLYGHKLEPYNIKFLLQDPHSFECHDIEIPTLPIWQIMFALHNAGDLQFQVSALGRGGSKSAQLFWALALTQEWGKAHPALQGVSLDALQYIIPLAIHLDGAEVFNNSEYYVFSVSSVLCVGAHVFDSKFQFLKIPHDMMREKRIKEGVFKIAAAYIAWNFEVLQSRKTPHTGFYGEVWPSKSTRATIAGGDIMGSYSAAFAAWKSDGKARAEAHLFPMNYSAIFCCDACLGTQGFPSVMRTAALRSLLVTNVDPDAPWRRTCFGHATYMQHSSRISPFMIIPGMHKDRILHDFLHLGPLGFLKDVNGSLCVSFLKHHELEPQGASPDEQLRALWVEFRKWCRERKISAPWGFLSMNMLGNPAPTVYPEMSSKFKASVMKVFAVFLAEKAVALAEIAKTEFAQLRATAAWAMARFLRISDIAGLILTDSQLHDLISAGRLFISAYMRLAQQAFERGEALWRFRPKLHYFDHLLTETSQSRLNPKHLGCWEDESYLGRIKKLGTKCHGKSMLTTSLLRYFLYLGLRWESRRRLQLWDLPL